MRQRHVHGPRAAHCPSFAPGDCEAGVRAGERPDRVSGSRWRVAVPRRFPGHSGGRLEAGTRSIQRAMHVERHPPFTTLANLPSLETGTVVAALVRPLRGLSAVQRPARPEPARDQRACHSAAAAGLAEISRPLTPQSGGPPWFARGRKLRPRKPFGFRMRPLVLTQALCPILSARWHRRGRNQKRSARNLDGTRRRLNRRYACRRPRSAGERRPIDVTELACSGS